MKIKKFERLESLYWKINTKQPNFSAALDKIGMSLNDIEKYSDMFHTTKDIYIFRDKYPFTSWSWAGVGSDSTWHNIYMGEVEVTNDDIEKWEAKKH